ncbi:B- and T-lymphocyte attenuator-like isoform X2 [Lithobates pipiens]
MSMDVSAPAWAPWRRAHSLLNTVLAVTLLALPLPGLGSGCTPNINLPKNSKAGQTLNQSLSLRCPVKLCSNDQPNVTWCRVERGANSQCMNVKSDDRISSGWEEKTENEVVHVLRFQFVQLNDTGFYKCSAAFKDMQIVGSVIEVTAPDSTSLPANSAKEQLKIVVYFMASAGGVCLMIIIISLLVFCQRRNRGKHRSSKGPERAEEVEFIATSVGPENCLERVKPSCPPENEFTTVPTETTYDNAHLGRRPSVPLSPEEDSIVYADLNYDAKKNYFQIEEAGEVEYATVRLN